MLAPTAEEAKALIYLCFFALADEVERQRSTIGANFKRLSASNWFTWRHRRITVIAI